MVTAVIASSFFLSGCMQEFEPQTSYVSSNQAAEAPNSYDNFVNAIMNSLTVDQFSADSYPWDFGYPTFYLMWDVMGQDIAIRVLGNSAWYSTWYTCGTALGPQYLYSQVPWRYFYKYIKNCNTVISLGGEEPSAETKTGVGIAYAMRAFFYMDLAQMFSVKPYAMDKSAETVPIITESSDLGSLSNNPRATNEDMYAFILSDLDKAEEFLAGYVRSDKYTPDLSVVYGLKARTYLLTQDWANAEKYAKLAQAGYHLMSASQYTSRETGFNTPNDSWMLGLTYKSNDYCLQTNDADSSWGSWMILEIDPYTSGCGYASNYGGPMNIDRHLYETIPDSDFRKKCFVDFAIDELDEADAIKALSAYSDHPDWVYTTGEDAYGAVGGLSLKFRAAGGEAGRANQYVGFVVAVPMMRVEEMYLIEAEAAGMQNEARGIELLTAFGKSRDADYVYGSHRDMGDYGTASIATNFQNEVWWQRRVEFWGEGFATKDIKRLNKGIIRSYANSNHADTYQWNIDTPPQWMSLCIVQTETNYNFACTNNPVPTPPTGGNSPEHIW